MKRIELFWNILYYCTYTLLYRCFRAIDPFRLIDNKHTRKFYKKDSIFGNHWIYEANRRKRKGFFSFYSYGIHWRNLHFHDITNLYFLNVIMIATHIPLYGVVFRDFGNTISFLLIVLLLLYVPNQLFLFKNGRYISYFKQFRKEPTNKYLKCYYLSYMLALIACSFSFILIELTKDKIEYFANNAG